MLNLLPMNPSGDQDPCQSRSLYTPELEHDACGIGFVAHLKGIASHAIVKDALTMLENMEHRGAVGCDPNTGDGAGILIQIPDGYFREVCAPLGLDLPEPGTYGVGMGFFPQDDRRRAQIQDELALWIERLGLQCLGYRTLPVDLQKAELGKDARESAPFQMQVFVRPQEALPSEQLERRLFILRKAFAHHIERVMPEVGDDFYFTSFSSRTIVYKGQLRTEQVRRYFPDLEDPRLHSALALVHSRFSTNTFPRWRLAQPFRYIAHNGEINTIRGNVNWMRAKESLMESKHFSKQELDWLMPICDNRYSDSHNLDSIVELLVMSGRSLPHVMMMLIPEAWENNPAMDPARRAFYAYHATLMEPWDGPASVCFTDGRIVGATLDRNGLRPSRYAVTEDDRLVMASEAGALPLRAHEVRERGRLQPGRIFVADLEAGRIISDEELKDGIARQQPYGKWLETHQLQLHALPRVPMNEAAPSLPLSVRQRLFGMTREEQRLV
ncbi:MAG: glutamate synthase subunit alpha, partial [Bacteroidetes bacterium]